MFLRREHFAALLVAVSLAASAHPSYAQWNADGVPLGAVTKPPDTTLKIAVAPLGTEWTAVTTSEWKTRSQQLVGKYVEVFGGIWTQGHVNRKSSFSNVGSLTDSTGKDVGQVLLDQASDEILSWMRKAKCDLDCQGVFIRGIVVDVSTTRVKNIEIRAIEVSYESKTGTAPAGSAALAMLSARDPDARKPLLPLGGDPGKAGTVTPAGASVPPADTAAKKGRMARWLKAAGITSTPGTFTRGTAATTGATTAAPKRGVFHFGDAPVTETTYRNVRDTELNGIFANAPWNMGRTMWPRVAIIVDSQGTYDVGHIQYGGEVANVCFLLRAKIWTGPAASRDVAPFNWCLSEMHYDTTVVKSSGSTFVGVAFTGLPLWGMTPKSMMIDQNTGPEVTTGPNPPYIPVPRFSYDDRAHSDVVMLGNLMRDMGFSYGVPDGRVWIVNEINR